MRYPKVTKPRVFLLVFLAALILWACDWFCSPPLRVSVADGIATIDVQHLGEYNSSLSEIVIRDSESNQVIWRATPQPPEDSIALWTFKIRPGKNSQRFNIGDGTKLVELIVIVPAGDDEITFLTAHRYEVAVRGEPWFGKNIAFHAKATFVL